MDFQLTLTKQTDIEYFDEKNNYSNENQNNRKRPNRN